MAAKKKVASAKDAGKMIVAFALRDFATGEGDEAVILTEGQRLDVPQKEFNAMSKTGLVAEGIFVKMKTAVEGGRYSLKPHDTTWLSPHVYEAWKSEGYCEPTDDDQKLMDRMKVQGETARAALSARDAAIEERDLAQKETASLAGELQMSTLQLHAARAQAEKLRDMIKPDPDSGDVLDDEAVALLGEVMALIDMFPEQIDVAGEASAEPQLKLD